MPNTNKKIFIAGEFGFVGKNVKSHLLKKGYSNFVSAPQTLDFRNLADTEKFISETKPEIVILAAGRVGGILANKKYPAEFLYDNLMIWSSIIKSSAKNKIVKLIFLGSATVYPKDAVVPFREEYLLTGSLDKNTEPYAVAKITAIKLCEALYISEKLNFFTLTLANLYGPFDHFDSEDSHVVPALISKIHNAKKNNLKEVEIWGSGKPTRDLLFVEDLADAIEFAINNIDAKMIYEQNISHLNVGTGVEKTIKELAEIISQSLGFKGEIKFDKSKPDGTMRKSIDTTRINKLGWKAKTSLEVGLKKTCEYYLSSKR
jgi:GDP-L-fucose synthase